MGLPSLELTLNVNEIEEEIYGALEQVLALETDKSASENAEQPLHQLGGESRVLNLMKYVYADVRMKIITFYFSLLRVNIHNSLHMTAGERDR